MNLGLVLIAWGAIIAVAIACLLGSGLVSVEITKDDLDDEPNREGKKNRV